MKKILLLLFCCLPFSLVSLAQSVDSLPPRQDTGAIKKDTVVKKAPDSPAVIKPPKKRVIDTTAQVVVVTPKPVPVVTDMDVPQEDSVRPVQVFAAQPYKGFEDALRNHPFFNFYGKPVALTIREKKDEDKDSLFYFIAGLLLYYGLIRLFFGKYLNNLMALFFRVTMRQQQLRDQLLQSPLPSFFLNLLFLITGGLYMTFLTGYYNFAIGHITNQWILLGWCAGLIMAIYMGKFIILKITGWVFNVKGATDTYIFIVFLVNKMIGIFLLPVLVIMAFSDGPVFSIVLTLSVIMLLFFFIYRFIISYRPIRSEIKVNRFHFFIYLCAFEVAPLLLIYKVLLIFVKRSY